MGFLWSYGIDPAGSGGKQPKDFTVDKSKSKRDYHTVCIHGLDERYINAQPQLKEILRFRDERMLDVFAYLQNHYFSKYPPSIVHVDSSRDPTFAELLERKLGESVVNFYQFTTDSKMRLMLEYLTFLKNGYALPDVDKLYSMQKITAEQRDIILELKIESTREQMRHGAGGKVLFSDGGKHNDLLHSSALSLLGISKIQHHGIANDEDIIVSHGSDGPAGKDGDGMAYIQERFSKMFPESSIDVTQ